MHRREVLEGTCIEVCEARATVSGLLMLEGRISGDSTNWELPHKNGRNLPPRGHEGCAGGGGGKLIVVQTPNTMAASGLQIVSALNDGGG